LPLDAPVTSTTSAAIGRPLSTAPAGVDSIRATGHDRARWPSSHSGEFTEAVAALAAHFGVERLRERLVDMTASRRAAG
jgi:hypothetical protein